MKKIITSLVSVLFLLTFGCASEDIMLLDQSKRAKKADAAIYADGKMPDKHYKEIAKLTFMAPPQDEFRAQRRLAKNAGKIGGDAILFTKESGGVHGGGGGMYGGPGLSESTIYKATVIVFE